VLKKRVSNQVFCHQLMNNQSIACLDWLYCDNGIRRVNPAAESTCHWILEHEEFVAWLEDDHGPRTPLWISGIPGSGKSTVCAYLVDHIRKTRRVGTAFYFFHHSGTAASRSARGLYQSLIYQLLLQIPAALSDFITKVRQKRIWHPQIPGYDSTKVWINSIVDTLEDCLLEISQRYSCTIFVDALDECLEDDVHRIQSFLWSMTLQGQSNSFRLCISNRQCDLPKTRRIRVDEENSEDIARFVWSAFESKQSYPIENFDITIHEIVERSNGIFLWVSLVLTQILNTRDQTPSPPLKTLLDIIPNSLENLYRYIMLHIESNEITRVGSKTLLRWIGLARRPLSLEELRGALELDLPDSAEILEFLSTSNIQSLNLRLQSRFWGLVVVRNNDVFLVHQTVRDLFSHNASTKCNCLAEDREEFLFCDRRHLALGVSCLKSIETTTNDKSNDFARYAAKYWMEHAKLGDSPELSHSDLIQTLLDLWTTVAHQGTKHQHGSLSTIRSRSPLQVAATYGLYGWTLALSVCASPKATYWDACDDNGRTALSFACEKGDLEIVEFLLYKGASLRSRDKKHQFTPLHWAALQDHKTVAAAVLKVGAESNDQLAACTPLSIAACTDSRAASQLLLAEGADPNLRDAHYGRAALHFAAAYGRKDIVELLWSSGADLNITERQYGHTPLHFAARYGQLVAAELLVHRGARLNLPDKTYGRTPLSWAIGGRHREVAKFFVEVGAEAPSGGFDYPVTKISWIDRVAHFLQEQVTASDSPRGPKQCPPGSAKNQNTSSETSKTSANSRNEFGKRPLDNSDSGEDQQDGDAGDSPRKRPAMNPEPPSPDERRLRLACPFYKYAPSRIWSQKICCGPHGWRNIHRLKYDFFTSRPE
jgi:ankyrin repeat protein